VATPTLPTPGETTATPEAPATPGGRFKAFRERHHVAFELAFFFAGFLFDVVLLHRIDSTPLLIHQAVYLVASGGLIFVDHRLLVSGVEPAGFLGKLASVRLWVMHFFLGTLLNAFMVFYFRASSGVMSFVFLVGLAALIVANELPRFRKQGPIVRVALLSFATTSFLAYLLPVVAGELERWHYYVSAALGAAVTVGLWRLFTRFTHDPGWTFQRAVLPGLVVQVTLVLLYLAGAVPPVPLSLKHIGLYESVTSQRSEAGVRYALRYQPAPSWQVWRDEAADFVASASGVCLARPRYERTGRACTKDAECGEGQLCSARRVWAYARIFAPSKFRDTVTFEWSFDDPVSGWTVRGMPYRAQLTGGTDSGFRTFAYSTIDKPGTYRVRVLTDDGREVGRQTFDARVAEPPASRERLD
jgi:hypothetical protein